MGGFFNLPLSSGGNIISSLVVNDTLTTDAFGSYYNIFTLPANTLLDNAAMVTFMGRGTSFFGGAGSSSINVDIFNGTFTGVERRGVQLSDPIVVGADGMGFSGFIYADSLGNVNLYAVAGYNATAQIGSAIGTIGYTIDLTQSITVRVGTSSTDTVQPNNYISVTATAFTI